MKRLLLALLVLASTLALIAQTKTSRPEVQFQAPEALSVTDITSPITCPTCPRPGFTVGGGTVVLDTLITETGKVERIEVRRDLGHFTESAAHAVESWKFSPATWAGRPIASRMPIAVTFRPPATHITAASPAPLIPQRNAAAQAELQPVEVLRATLPNYPLAAVAAGAVVLEVTVNETGGAVDIKVLRDLPPLTEEAKAAARNWRFMAATLNGVPIQSKIVLAFVFPALVSSG